MSDQIKKTIILNVIIGLVVISLIMTGIWLMVQSHQMYNYSLKISQEATNPPAGKQAQVLAPGYNIIKDGYAQALLFFTLSLGALLLLLLLPRLQNLSIGPSGITMALKEVRDNLESVVKQNNTVQSDSVGPGGGKTNVKTAKHAQPVKESLTKNSNDDPQKCKWSGKAFTASRKMEAIVTDSPIKELYQVEITVKSTKPDKPLQGIVKFHLHDSFRNPDPVIAVENGMAVLKLTRVYGAFTVGAEADDGDTTLELDLAELPDAPKEFKER